MPFSASLSFSTATSIYIKFAIERKKSLWTLCFSMLKWYRCFVWIEKVFRFLKKWFWLKRLFKPSIYLIHNTNSIPKISLYHKYYTPFPTIHFSNQNYTIMPFSLLHHSPSIHKKRKNKKPSRRICVAAKTLRRRRSHSASTTRQNTFVSDAKLCGDCFVAAAMATCKMNHFGFFVSCPFSIELEEEM